MLKFLLAATLCAAVTATLNGDPCAAVAGDSRSEAVPQLPQSQWSDPVEGVRGRLIVTPIDSGNTPQFKLEVELQNVSDIGMPIEIWWTPSNSIVDLTLADEKGDALPGLIPPRSGPHAGPFWLPLMIRSSVKVVIAERAYRYGPEDKVWLQPSMGKLWTFSRSTLPTRLFIGGVVQPREDPERRERAWKGPLMLPRVVIPAGVR